MEYKQFLDSVPADFWTIVQEARQDPGRFRKLLANIKRDKMIQFYWTYDELAYHLRTEQFLPYIHLDLSEDGHAELANWVVSQGKEYYENILENPEMIPSKKDDAGLQSELLEEYEQRYKDDLPMNTNFWDVEWKQSGKQSPWD